MEDEVCQFGKFGFCKYKEGCKRKHFNKICESLRCINIKECPRRHPKTCRRFNSGQECRFKEECAYNHIRKNPDEEQIILKEKVEVLEKTVSELTKKVKSKENVQLEKVDEEENVMKEKIEVLEKAVSELTNKLEAKKLVQLEKVVHALTRKVLSLETEVEAMKSKTQTDKNPMNENCLIKESSFNNSVIKHSSSTPKAKKDKIEKDTSDEEMLKCKECKYKCKKEITLKKHMVTNHENHKCKECKEELSTFMELLKHVAQHHSNERVDINKEENEKGLLQDMKDKHVEEDENDSNEEILVFKESK